MTIVPRSRPVAGEPLDTPRPSRRQQRAWQAAALASVCALALFAGLRWRSWEALQGELLRIASAAGLEGEALAETRRAARRELDPGNARLEVARALLERELLNLEPGDPASFERLATARELARQALADQPANHEAAMVLGATISLERSRSRDARLASRAADWERPLETAESLAPGAVRPRHLLAAAYLEVWPALSPAKRARAEGLLREALTDRRVFDRLASTWIATAGSLERAATLLPDEPRSWRLLADTALTDRSFAEHVRLLDRYRESLAATLAGTMAGGETGRTERGTPSPAFFADSLPLLPLDGAFVPILERLLALRPPGAASSAEALAAEAWFEWAAPLCLIATCPLGDAALDRLAFLAGGKLAPEQLAFAALATGDTAKAAQLERRAESAWSESWAPYQTMRARRRLASGDRAGTRSILEHTHSSFRARAAWRELAAASGLTPPAPARTLWEASDWWFDRGASRLDLVAAVPASGLRIEPLAAPADGALVELLWDGERKSPIRFEPGAASARLAISVTPGPHLLEIRRLWGEIRPAMRVKLD